MGCFRQTSAGELPERSSGNRSRHHLDRQLIQKAVRPRVLAAGLTKPATPATLFPPLRSRPHPALEPGGAGHPHNPRELLGTVGCPKNHP